MYFIEEEKFTEELPDLDLLWNYGKPDITEAKFREILPVAKLSGNISYYAQLLTQIARTEGLQHKFDLAHKTLDKVKPLISNIKLVEARYLLERGRIFNSSKNPDKAKPLFLKAFDLGQKAKLDFYAIDAAHMLGIIEKSPEEQLKWNEKAITLSEKTADPKAKKWLGSLYNNVGWTYHDNGEFAKALDYFSKNVEWHEDKHSVQPLIIAKWAVAKTIRSLNQVDVAIKMLNDLLREIEEKDLEEDGYIYEELGICYVLKENEPEARKNFAIAYALLSRDPWLKKNEPETLERLKLLGGIK
jgi:tetratricopeptide (TPR) repeat protein